MFLMRLLLLLFLFFISPFQAVETKQVGKAELTLFSPNNLDVVTKEQVLFKGVAKHIQELSINNQSVPIKNDRFYFKIDLEKKGHYQSIEVLAITTENKTIKFSRDIYYLDKADQEKDIQDQTESFRQAYLELGWQELNLDNAFIYKLNRNFPDAAKRFSLPVQINSVYLEKQSQFILSRSLVLMRQEELVLIVPWCSRLSELTLFSHYLAKALFQNSVVKFKSVTIVFYNKNRDVLELFYPSLAQLPSPKWLLNDKVLKQPLKLKAKTKINTFVNAHYIAY